MAVIDIRQRTGYLFLAVVVGHVILISTQVTTKRGVPMLEEVTFGAFSEVQRGRRRGRHGVRDVGGRTISRCSRCAQTTNS